jgi:hypothetical protein
MDIKYNPHHIEQTSSLTYDWIGPEGFTFEQVSYVICCICGGMISGPPHNPDITGVVYKPCSCVRASAPERQGWQCPSCKTIHSPDTKTCSCSGIRYDGNTLISGGIRNP